MEDFIKFMEFRVKYVSGTTEKNVFNMRERKLMREAYNDFYGIKEHIMSAKLFGRKKVSKRKSKKRKSKKKKFV